MKITFLGTGADTAYPLPFCNCISCATARERGGKNLRKRSSILINEDLIDVEDNLLKQLKEAAK